jgi:hypothetical protein
MFGSRTLRERGWELIDGSFVSGRHTFFRLLLLTPSQAACTLANACDGLRLTRCFIYEGTT